VYRKVNIKKSDDPARHLSPWMVRWRTVDGRHHKASFPTKTLAVQYANRIRTEINSPLFSETISLSWQDLTDEFIADKKSARLAQSTINVYNQVFTAFAKVNRYPDSDKITVRHIDRYRNSLPDNSPVTINKNLRHLNALFEWAVKRDYMAKNPVKAIQKLREPKKAYTILSPVQFAKVLEVCTDRQWKVLIHLAVNGVARKYSIAALEVGDIDFADGTIRVCDKKQHETRIAPVHPATMKILTDYVNDLPAGQKKLFTCKFHNTTWQNLLKKANVPHIKFHSLRTCMSTWLKQAGVSDGVVTAIFGHSDPGITTRYYTALDDVETRRVAVNKLPL